MNKELDNDLRNLFRNYEAEAEPAELQLSWVALQEHLPRRKRRRFLFWWFFTGVFSLTMLITFMKNSNTAVPPGVRAEMHVQEAAAQAHTKSISSANTEANYARRTSSAAEEASALREIPSSKTLVNAHEAAPPAPIALPGSPHANMHSPEPGYGSSESQVHLSDSVDKLMPFDFRYRRVEPELVLSPGNITRERRLHKPLSLEGLGALFHVSNRSKNGSWQNNHAGFGLALNYYAGRKWYYTLSLFYSGNGDKQVTHNDGYTFAAKSPVASTSIIPDSVLKFRRYLVTESIRQHAALDLNIGIGIPVLRFPKFNANLLLQLHAGSVEFEAERRTVVFGDTLFAMHSSHRPANVKLTVPPPDFRVSERQTFWGISPGIHLSYRLTQKLALSLRSWYFMNLSEREYFHGDRKKTLRQWHLCNSLGLAYQLRR